jgi:K+-transporting ATPase ATPase A chain
VAGWLQAVVVIVVVGALHVPLGDYMARTFCSARHWRAERMLYGWPASIPTPTSAGPST